MLRVSEGITETKLGLLQAHLATAKEINKNRLCSMLPACSCLKELFDVLGAAALLSMDGDKGRASLGRRLITGYLFRAERGTCEAELYK